MVDASSDATKIRFISTSIKYPPGDSRTVGDHWTRRVHGVRHNFIYLSQTICVPLLRHRKPRTSIACLCAPCRFGQILGLTGKARLECSSRKSECALSAGRLVAILHLGYSTSRFVAPKE